MVNDRVPLEQAIDKEPEIDLGVDKREEVAPDETIDEMRDLKMLSVMMGFEKGFDGVGEHAEALYAWAKTASGELGGGKVLQHVKNVIRELGLTERGVPLMRKLSMYATLDTRQRDLQTQKNNLAI